MLTIKRRRRLLLLSALLAASAIHLPAVPAATPDPSPPQPESFRFGAVGDFGMTPSTNATLESDFSESITISGPLAPPVPDPVPPVPPVPEPGPPGPPADVGVEAEAGLVGGGLMVVPDATASGGDAVRFAGLAPPVAGDGIRAAGNRLVRNGAPFVPVGFTMVGVLSPDITTGVGAVPAAHLDDAAMEAAIGWGANTIRFQVSQRGLDFTDPLYSDAYLDRVAAAVALAHAHGLAVILSVQDQQGLGGGTRHPQPSDATIRDWQALASRFNADPDVMYEMFNEPQNRATPAGWSVWRDGGPPEGNQGTPAVGHQNVLNNIRATGAHNLVLADGAQYAQLLDGLPPLYDPLGQIAYAIHPYLTGALRDPASWERGFAALARQFPVVATEWNAHSRASFCQPEWATTAPQLLDLLQSRDIGLFGWAFDVRDSLILDWNHTPTSMDGFQCGLPDRGAGTLVKARMPGFQPHVPSCPAALSDQDAVVVPIDVPQDGLYRLWSRARAPDLGPGWAPLLQIDDQCRLPAWAGQSPPGQWSWLSGPGAVVSLTAGRHTIRLLSGAAGVDVDRILLTANLNAPATGFGP